MGYGEQFEGGVLSYGGVGGREVEDKKGMIFVPQQRRRLNYKGVLASIFLPWLLFTALLYVMGSNWHYFNPLSCWCLVIAAYILVAIVAGIAFKRKVDDKDPSWYTYCAGAFFVAVTLATILGNYMFFEETEKYYDYLTLNTYAAVSPDQMVGQMVMDAGRVYFASGVQLNTARTAGFKHGDTYCVAPIDMSNGQKLQTYDFWAVGVNCCDNPKKFHCGRDVNNYRARSGLRLMNEEQRPFFRLAVQQAEAAYGITANHPVFFHWSQDPLKEIHNHLQRAIKIFIQSSGAVFLTNFCAVIWASFAFAKMGRAA